MQSNVGKARKTYFVMLYLAIRSHQDLSGFF